MISEYDRLRPSSRLSAALRPLTRQGLDCGPRRSNNSTIRGEGKKENFCSGQTIRNSVYTKYRTLPKLEAIFGLYLNPPELELVLSVDEKSQIQALETSPRLCDLLLLAAQWEKGAHRISIFVA